MTTTMTHPKVLVTYATWLGSTTEIALTIGDMLRAGGHEVEVTAIPEVKYVGPFRTVIVGGPIRVGEWSPDVVNFLEANRHLLRDRRLALFVTCLTMRMDSPESRHIVRGYIQPVLDVFPDLKPFDIGLFAGAFDVHRVPGREQVKLWSKPHLQGDFRDWTAIREWATGVSAYLASLEMPNKA